MSLLKAIQSGEGKNIEFKVYDDVVNIVSPGTFPSTITQEDLVEGRLEIWNKVIARVFKELNYIEQWGSGIRRIKSSCKARKIIEFPKAHDGKIRKKGKGPITFYET